VTAPSVTGRLSGAAVAVAGLAGLGVAVVLRVRIAGMAGPASVPAGLVVGAALLALAAALGVRVPRLSVAQVATGVGGAAVLCVPIVAHRIAAGHGALTPVSGFPPWALGVTLVAVAEEALLRGALYDRIAALSGPAVAIAVTAVAFALLHAPVYGWTAVPLDLAVGVWLGGLRQVSGSVSAPAIAHTLADLAGWWLR
jgi:membrane protease YdiL (CAAX protease family)